jgi:hypothetical protein
VAVEPKQEDRDAQGSERKATSWSEVKGILLNNPALSLSLLYVYVTVIGMLYSAVLYGGFGINIFDYSEIADFLLSALKNPVALLAVVLLIGAFAVLIALWMLLSKRNASNLNETVELRRAALQSAIRRLNEDPGIDSDQAAARIDAERHSLEVFVQEQKARTAKINRWLAVRLATFFSIAFVLISIIVPFASARTMTSSIKEGRKPVVDVRYRSFSGSAGQVTEPGLQLIGATQKAAFFYDPDEKRTIVIPQAQVVSIEVPD